MESCSKCTKEFYILDQGIIEIQSINQVIMTSIKELLTNIDISYHGQDFHVRFQYESIEQLISVLKEIDHSFNQDTKGKLYCITKHIQANAEHFSPNTPFLEFYHRASNREYLTIINEQLFTSFLQPVVSLKNLNVYGYEFLLRPSGDISFNPGELFSFSRKAGLQSLLDSQARVSSIKTSAQLVENGFKRFINFLPSSIYDPNHCLRSTFAAVEKYGVDANDLIFEVVETERIDDINHLKNIFDVYKKHGIKVALDDLGSGFATMEVLKQLQPNYAKLDRSIIDYCDQNKEKQETIAKIVQIANEYNIILLAEGVERKEEAEFCKTIGIPLAQGYYFAPPSSKPISSLTSSAL
ncbi:EAL domain-containing protein [Anaerobacillus alkaliphilus]|nr:EAL domain-containing protein [Anaerobacillus alkaliphilus]